MKLGTLLLRNATIGLGQLESALRNQVLYGGRLGTNLVELGVIDLEVLSHSLADMTGTPIATQTLLDHADRGLLDRLGAAKAHQLGAIPLAMANGAALVAMVDPGDKLVVDTLTAALGVPIAPHVTPELRILYYLERHYGLPRQARFVRSSRPTTDREVHTVTGARDRRRSQPPPEMVMPPQLTLEPRRRRASTAQPALRAPEPIALSYGAACERIDTATDRDHIAATFLAYARGRCDALVLFLIRDGNAIGWRGYVATATSSTTEPPGLADVALPLSGASALQSAHDSGQTFAGTPPSAARPIESQLWSALGVEREREPASVVVAPIVVKQRAVNLVYAHVAGGVVSATLISELTDLAGRAQSSYARLIRQARGV